MDTRHAVATRRCSRGFSARWILTGFFWIGSADADRAASGGHARHPGPRGNAAVPRLGRPLRPVPSPVAPRGQVRFLFFFVFFCISSLPSFTQFERLPNGIFRSRADQKSGSTSSSRFWISTTCYRVLPSFLVSISFFLFFGRNRLIDPTRSQRIQVLADGTLQIAEARASDVGEYACQVRVLLPSFSTGFPLGSTGWHGLASCASPKPERLFHRFVPTVAFFPPLYRKETDA